MKLLVVEDEQLMADLIRSIILSIPGVKKVDRAPDYKNALRKLASRTYHMVLVDLYLDHDPHNGLDLCKKIRSQDPFKPILIITSDTSFESQRKAFGIYVNDYIKKPFHPQELLLRIQRWLPKSTERTIRYRQLSYVSPRNEFYFNNQKIPLTKKSKELLLYFIQNREKVLPPESIEKSLWGEYDPLENRNIRSSIQYLRRALKPTSCDRWIVTIRGEGYMLKK